MDPSPFPQRRNSPRRFTARTRTGAWYRIENHAATDSSARILIYDEIGWFGISAEDLVRELDTLDVAALDVRLNSPGGSVFDGAAVFHALRNHPAKVTVTVDGLAASAASFIAQAGDEIIMEPASTMMIHEAFTWVAGSADDLRAEADLLDKMSTTIAGIYATRSGRSVDDFRELMKAETWFNATEAVAAGLADRVAGTDEADPATQGDGSAPAARWDLSIFNFAGRDQAPAPVIPQATATPVATAPPVPTEPPLDLAAVIRNAIQEAKR